MKDMSNLKSVITQIEGQRKQRMRMQLIVAGVAVLGAIGLVTYFSPHIRVVKEVPPEPEPHVSAYEQVKLSAKAAIVYDLVTGEVLYKKNAEAQLPLASLTKLLTVYAAAEALGPDAPVTMTAEALSAEGDNGFAVGEVFSFKDAARLALVASSNDAAAAIAASAAEARHASNSTALLASAAAALGLSQTYALNGTGLDENGKISGAYGSPHDIAVLAGEFLKRAPDIARASLEPTISAVSRSGFSYTLKNTNPDTGKIPGLLLSKTGFTDLAGGNLAVVYDAGIGHPIAVVVMGSTKDERFLDVEKLVKATAEEFAGLSI